MLFPYKRKQIKPWLKNFFDKRFKDYGRFQDAIDPNHPFLFHSCISPMLNIGLLTPQELIDEFLDYTKNSIPLNSKEGFIRQVIGWREFMRGMYEVLGKRWKQISLTTKEKSQNLSMMELLVFYQLIYP